MYFVNELLIIINLHKLYFSTFLLFYACREIKVELINKYTDYLSYVFR